MDKTVLRIVSTAIGAELSHVDTLVGEMNTARRERSSLAFRHVFRNIYCFELKGERIIRLSDRLAGVAASFKKEISSFRRLLESEIRDSST